MQTPSCIQEAGKEDIANMGGSQQQLEPSACSAERPPPPWLRQAAPPPATPSFYWYFTWAYFQGRAHIGDQQKNPDRTYYLGRTYFQGKTVYKLKHFANCNTMELILHI